MMRRFPLKLLRNSESKTFLFRNIGSAAYYNQSFEVEKLPTTETSTLKTNGLRVASENWHLPTCTVGIWLDVGSRLETEADHGAAHLIERMAFKGTEKRNLASLTGEVESRGARLHAYTSREMSAFYVKCLSRDVPWAVELLAEVIKKPQFDEKMLEREKALALSEMTEIESDCRAVIFDYLHATAYQGTPLGRPIWGSVESVKAMTSSTLRDFMKRWYRAPTMVLAGAGGVNHRELHDLASQHLGDISANYETGVPNPVQCRFTGSEIRDRDDAMPLAHVAVAMEGPGWASSDTLDLLVAIFLHGMWDRNMGGGGYVASSLASNFFKDGGVHKFEQFLLRYHDTSLWGFYIAAEKMALTEAVAGFQRELVRMCTSVAEYEVARARNLLKQLLCARLDNGGMGAVCEELARDTIAYRRRIPMSEMLERIDGISAERLRGVCMKYLYDRCPAVAAIGPVETLHDYNRIRNNSWWLRF